MKVTTGITCPGRADRDSESVTWPAHGDDYRALIAERQSRESGLEFMTMIAEHQRREDQFEFWTAVLQTVLLAMALTSFAAGLIWLLGTW